MMTTQEVLKLYSAMAKLSEMMVAAATAGDWDEFVRLEQRCATHTRTLKAHEPAEPLRGEPRERKIELIRQILMADRQIRDLTMPWMSHLSALIHNTKTERRLINAYGSV